ncbi:MAG: AlpA family transcriptional regulator [Sphingomonadales bacterium RIFCSPLOWO2_12_FULL_63_15]|nr:MAG: AlpA family transcriptional regulator [Sphingomonadales bacterium RIFCSPLOWO2_12_FULL_63_15]
MKLLDQLGRAGAVHTGCVPSISLASVIYDMEQRGEFPQRFYLTSRCVVWDLAEVEAWLAMRRQASNAKTVKRAPSPDVHLRKTRPVTR